MRPIDPGYHRVSTDLALAEEEQAFREQMVTTGRTVPDATRDLYPHEIRAGIRFAELDRESRAAAAALARLWAGLRESSIEALDIYLMNYPDTLADLIAALANLADPDNDARLARIAPLIEQATLEMAIVLERTVDQAYVGAATEAAGQGVELPAAKAPAPEAARLLQSYAYDLARHAPRHAIEAAQRAARAATGDPAGPARRQIVQEAAAASTAAGDDLSNRAANGAVGAGRMAAATAGPEPTEIYASELLDRNTCRPCSRIDGTDYPSLAAARADYPLGGYRACEGGSRCRGTLVFVYDESPPTVP